MSEFVPEVLTVEEIYPAALKHGQTQRWEHLLAKFQERYGHRAEFVSRSPGRVNIIGEHIDYMLFAVLPMAVTADMLLAVRVTPENNTIKIANVLDRFPAREFKIPSVEGGDLEIDSSKLEWSNYFKAGLKGAVELLRKRGIKGGDKPPGMEILVDGTVPTGGGLSSSAAFVCASALAGLKAMGEEKVDKKDLVNLAIVSERYVGVNSGGMDQSASVLGIKDSALHIAFHPTLDAKPVAFPKTVPELVFVIAKTFVTAEKHTTAPIHYNLRVVECTLAAQILANKLGVDPLPQDAGPLGSSLKGLMDNYFKDRELGIKDKFELMAQLVKVHLKGEVYTREEIADTLGISVEELVKRYMTRFPIRAEKFKLQSRALHVFLEARRVAEFTSLLTAPHHNYETADIVHHLGLLMNESQDSCRDLYDCSCPELDELCNLARASGSYGSRLTGAGWGGCSVHLMAADKVDKVREVWKREYYQKRFLEMEDEDLEDLLKDGIVVSAPGSGAVLFDVTA
ncbi:galactokinase [Rhizina undulata]